MREIVTLVQVVIELRKKLTWVYWGRAVVQVEMALVPPEAD